MSCLRARQASEAELAKPQFEGLVNGVYIKSTFRAVTDQPTTVCSKAQSRSQVAVSELKGTPFEIEPAYLPAGATEQQLSPNTDESLV